MIRFEDITVAYGSTIALDEIRLDLGPGVTGLFGPNAAGKSTLLRVAAGLLEPTLGRVLWRGHPVRRSVAARRRIGWVGHDAGLYANLSVHENLTLFARLYDASSADVTGCIEMLELGPKAGAPIASLSAGLRRRASVARALLHTPATLLLDEPYANLDDEAAGLVSGAIRLWRERTRGQGVCLIATHGAKRVKSFADAGIILQRGRVVSHRIGRPGR